MLEVRRRPDLGQETLGADDGGELRLEDLDGDLPMVSEVLGEIDRSHPSLAKLALDAVAVDQRRGESIIERGHLSICHLAPTLIYPWVNLRGRSLRPSARPSAYYCQAMGEGIRRRSEATSAGRRPNDASH